MAAVLLLVISLVAALAILVVHRRWRRLAAERSERFDRLLRHAALEAELIEQEEAIGQRTTALAPVRSGTCAVCGVETKRRCAKCKAVKYCSSKCQIIHWRRGHKDECHPPVDSGPVETSSSDTRDSSNLAYEEEIIDSGPIHDAKEQISIPDNCGDTNLVSSFKCRDYQAEQSKANSSCVVGDRQFSLISTETYLRRHNSRNDANCCSLDTMLFPYDVFIKLCNSNDAGLHPFGLENIGSSCYANAVLQCVMFTRPLTAYFLGGLHSKKCIRTERCLMCELENLVKSGKQASTTSSAVGVLASVTETRGRFGDDKEEDAHEFMRYLIDAMQAVCIKESRYNAPSNFCEESTNLMQLIFGGYLFSKIKCARCQGHSDKCEPMMDISVEVDGNIDTLEKALRQFTHTETLDGENKYYCTRCQSYVRARKKLTISEAPNVLTIALKRFQSGRYGKIGKTIRFPKLLNLADYMSGGDDATPVYTLYGAVVHHDAMNTASSGHYLCYVKDMLGKWYRINDSQVGTAVIEEVQSECAYILFYARCSPRAPSSVRKAMSRIAACLPHLDLQSDTSSLFSSTSDESSTTTESSGSLSSSTDGFVTGYNDSMPDAAWGRFGGGDDIRWWE